MITLEMFTKRFYEIGFDLAPDWEAGEEHICLQCQGNERIEALFKNSFPESVTFIL